MEVPTTGELGLELFLGAGLVTMSRTFIDLRRMSLFVCGMVMELLGDLAPAFARIYLST